MKNSDSEFLEIEDVIPNLVSFFYNLFANSSFVDFFPECKNQKMRKKECLSYILEKSANNRELFLLQLNSVIDIHSREMKKKENQEKIDKILEKIGFYYSYQKNEIILSFFKGLKVFIAYVKEDVETAEELYDKLKDNGFKETWMFSRDKVSGVDWDQFNQERIKTADFLIACFSNNVWDRKSSEFHKEIRIALEEYEKRIPNSIYLIPIKLEKCEIPKYKVRTISIAKLNYTNYFEPDGCEQIIRSIRYEIMERKKRLRKKN